MQGEWDIGMDDDDEITDALFEDRDPDMPTRRDGSGTARRATIRDILSSKSLSYPCHTLELYLLSLALFEMQSSNALINPTGGQSISLGRITLQDLSRVIRRSNYIDRTYTGDDEDEEDSAEGGDDDDEEANYDSVRRASHQWFPEVTEPQKAGVELLMSGDFGRVGNKIKSRQNDVNIAKLINNQSSRLRQASYKEDYASVSLFSWINTHSGTNRMAEPDSKFQRHCGGGL
jgi:WD repeat-containing protein 23